MTEEAAGAKAMVAGRDEAEVILKAANWAVLKIVGCLIGFGVGFATLALTGWLERWKNRREWEKVMALHAETPAPSGLGRNLRVTVGPAAPMSRRVENGMPESGENGISENRLEQ